MKASDIAAQLALNIEALAEHLLGKPSLRTRDEWRYGKKGSFAIVVAGSKRGGCYDHEKQQGGDALWFVQRARGGHVRDAMDWSIAWLGGTVRDIQQRPSAPAKPAAEEQDRSVAPRRIWSESIEIIDTLGAAYLKYRRAWPVCEIADLRFHPECPMGDGLKLPAMVALMRNILSNEPQAIHRTPLLADGMGKHPIGKKMLGKAAGTAIKLYPDAVVTTGLGIAEGIENAMSLAAQGWGPIWPVGSAGAIRLFPVIDGVECLTIFGDADDSGAGGEAAVECARRWQAASREAIIRMPPAGTDWNDLARKVAA